MLSVRVQEAPGILEREKLWELEWATDETKKTIEMKECLDPLPSSFLLRLVLQLILHKPVMPLEAKKIIVTKAARFRKTT